MRNKIVGYVIIGIALLIGLIVYSFNRALTDIVSTACGHGIACPMWGTIKFQTSIGMGIMVFVILIGLYLIFLGDKKTVKKISHKVMNELTKEERAILKEIKEAEGTIFQSDLVEKTGMSKVKVTRLLDRLEGSGLIERKRRGMTNVVILKH